MKKILVTGSAGFIGFHLVKALLGLGYKVIGIDNINDYYDRQLKTDRLNNLETFIRDNQLDKNYQFIKIDIADQNALENLFHDNHIDIVINLAAKAGVRYSLDNPSAYVSSNLVGFTNLLECCRHAKIQHLIFASSSSVYGMNTKQPFSALDNTDYPISLYAATKKSNELLAHSYSHLFKMPCTGLRFFTVYGPYGRPDMAYYKFTKAISEGKPIDVYNNGIMKRDFTFIDDIVKGIIELIEKPPAKQASNITSSDAPFKVYNIGNNNPVTLRQFIEAIEAAVGKKAIENLLPMQAGDVPITYADIDELEQATGFRPSTSIEDGLEKFVKWYKSKNLVTK